MKEFLIFLLCGTGAIAFGVTVGMAMILLCMAGTLDDDRD